MIGTILKLFFFVISTYVIFISYACYYPHSVPVNEWKKSEPPFPSERFNNLFWFIQVSDIHVSKFHDPDRGPDFQRFCNTTLDVMHPEVVLVTGDLTDAKSKDRYYSQQFLSEWKQYNEILLTTNATQRYTWIDIRGNHDTYNVVSRDDSYYLKYSGDKEKRSSSAWKLVKSFGNYSFIPVDATSTPGPSRPFNFMGQLSERQLDKLYQEGEEASGSNLTVWYSHYPSSSIVSNSMVGLRSVMGQFGAVFLNGHYHTLQGIASTMYAMHSNGFLELELSDWMEHRKFRVVAVDHDMLSFTDEIHGDWPVILITNPKPATYMIPRHEPIARIRNSTHIRFLVFGPHKIRNLEISINGMNLKDAFNVEGPLWVCKWNPDQYRNGMHRLQIKVQDSSGKQKMAVSDFSLDKEWSTSFNWTGVFFILTDICTLAKVLFVFLTAGLLSVIVTVKRCGVSNMNGWFFNLHLLVSDNVSFYAISAFILNLLIGPLFIGELLSGHFGVCFSYGMLISGGLSSESVIYIFCLEIVLTSYIPIVIYLSRCAKLRWSNRHSFIASLNPTNSFFKYNLLLLLHIYSQVYSCYCMRRSYGLVAGIVNPACLWWGITTIMLLIRLWNRNPQNMLRKA